MRHTLGYIGCFMVVMLNLCRANDPELKPRLGDIPEKSATPIKDPFKPGHEKSRGPQKDPTIEENYQLIQDVTDEFYRRGLRAMKAGDLTTAEGYFDRVLVIKPSHKGAREAIALIMKKYDQGQKRDVKVQSQPAQLSAQEKLIKKLESQLEKRMAESNYEDAKTVVEELLAVDPQNREARKTATLIRQKLYANAVNRAQQLEELGDERGAIDSYLLAMTYGRNDSLKIKIASLRERLHEKNKTTSADLYLDALRATQDGDNEKALKLCRSALALDPKNLQAQRMLERLAVPNP